ncbi:unnamed protein product [Symbiodinium sp. CCMP2592]|nr:unnamed protein product [Symbiodinium sp. CCMP2592]
MAYGISRPPPALRWQNLAAEADRTRPRPVARNAQKIGTENSSEHMLFVPSAQRQSRSRGIFGSWRLGALPGALEAIEMKFRIRCGAGVVRDWQDFCHRPRSRGQVLFSGAWLRLGTFFLWQVELSHGSDGTRVFTAGRAHSSELACVWNYRHARSPAVAVGYGSSFVRSHFRQASALSSQSALLAFQERTGFSPEAASGLEGPVPLVISAMRSGLLGALMLVWLVSVLFCLLGRYSGAGSSSSC